jgi:hypothetical protein
MALQEGGHQEPLCSPKSDLRRCQDSDGKGAWVSHNIEVGTVSEVYAQHLKPLHYTLTRTNKALRLRARAPRRVQVQKEYEFRRMAHYPFRNREQNRQSRHMKSRYRRAS